MNLKPLPIAAALVGGGGLALVAGSAAVAQANAFAPAGLSLGAGLAALALAKPGNGEALRAFGYAAVGLSALFGWAGYQAHKAAAAVATTPPPAAGTTPQATHGNLAYQGASGNLGHMAGADLVNIVGGWISQNMVAPQQGGMSNWSYNLQKHDMTGRRAPAAWGGNVRGTSRAGF